MTDLQRGSMLKRISALILDVILLTVLGTGFGWAVSAVARYDSYSDRLTAMYEKYANDYNVKENISSEEYESLPEEEKARYEAADKAMQADKEMLYVSNMVYNITFLTVSLAVFLSFFVLEFILPLCFKNGQTLGKKIFGLAVMRTEGIRLQPFLLFIRSMVGKCLIGFMIPILLLLMCFMGVMDLTGVVVAGLLLLLELVLVAATRTRSAVHDLLAGTVVVDFASQRIFDTEADRIEYQKRLAAERAEKTGY